MTIISITPFDVNPAPIGPIAAFEPEAEQDQQPVKALFSYSFENCSGLVQITPYSPRGPGCDILNLRL
jgi:hypothetical protein